MKTSNENDASPTDIDRDAPAIIRLERVIPAHRQRIWDLHADVAGWPKWQLDIATASIDGQADRLDDPCGRTASVDPVERPGLWNRRYPSLGIRRHRRRHARDHRGILGGRARRGKSYEGSQDARNVTRTLARLPRHGGDILKAKMAW
jgi:hypothetical protein